MHTVGLGGRKLTSGCVCKYPDLRESTYIELRHCCLMTPYALPSKPKTVQAMRTEQREQTL